jgi:multimeric flavodoxin WrbA
MERLTVIQPGEPSERFGKMLEYALEGYNYNLIKFSDEITDLRNKRILFALDLYDAGINLELYKILNKICLSGDNFLQNSVGSIIVNSENELFTRDMARKTIFYANMAGCLFPGRPLIEATGSLKTLRTFQKKENKELNEILLEESKNIVSRLMNFNFKKLTNPKILAIHSSNYATSNTLQLWNIVKKQLTNFQIKEIYINNNSIIECKACSYEECKDYSKNTSCYYKDIITEEVYPSLLESDILIMLCPNYNDSISASMTAVINRLTALFRKVKFYDKYLYSIIVSGQSGSDIVAQQLISALNINKTFMLPPKFALMETANDYGEIERVDNIMEKAANFASNINLIKI